MRIFHGLIAGVKSCFPKLTNRRLWVLAAVVGLGLGTLGWVKRGGPPAPVAAGKSAGKSSGVPAGEGQALRQKIETLTGGPTRIVWARDMGSGKDTFANGTELALMGLDTQMGTGERRLTEALGNYSRPQLGPDGAVVYFSRREAEGAGDAAKWRSGIHALDWAGGTIRRLHDGYAVEVWRDRQTGVTWIYALTVLRDGVGANPEGTRLFRFRVDAPEHEEVIWEHGLISGDNFQLNRAGTMASGLIPWPNAGAFDFRSGTFIRHRNGCWPSMAPDDSGMLWVFDGTHTNIRMFLPGVDDNWRVPLSKADGMKGKAQYHPRWSNDPRIICFTGPHPVAVDKGSGNVSVVLAKFNDRLTALTESVSLKNHSGEPDCYPDVWVAGGEKVDLDVSRIGPQRVRDAAAHPAPGAAWQAPPEGLVFVWQQANANNQVPEEKRECSLTPRRYARYGPRFDAWTEGGTFVMDEGSAQAVRHALQTGPWHMELAVTPLRVGQPPPQVIFRAGPDLEIQQSGWDFIIHLHGRDYLAGAGLALGRTTHLALGGSDDAAPPTVWINGKPQEMMPGEAHRHLPPARTEEVQFGARGEQEAAWTGRLENIAFNARAFDPASATRHAAWWREELSRAVAPLRSVVRARLKEASPRAPVESIKPYHRSWTSALYERTALISGKDPGAEFGVAHWTILDGAALTGPPGLPGEERELVLEPMSDHPEMDSEHGSEEILSDGQPLFLDMGVPGG